VLYLDLDRFKLVNDRLGHEAGDQVLVAVAERLRRCVRAGDTPARLGGDEFAVLLEGVVDVRRVVEVAERLGEALRAPIALGERRRTVAASIGIALSGPGRQRPEDLLRRADSALYQAKRAGRASYEVYPPPGTEP
jgi:diguanylate cyclase (GGDEF)-like protein